MSQSLPHLIAGLLVTILLGFGVRPLLSRATESMPPIPPSEASEKQKQQWKELVAGNEGGAVLGWLERLMFFAAFIADAPIAVGAWLAFKVASKWQAWTSIISVPSKIEGFNDELDFLIARRRWGSHLLITFLIGTAYNVLAGMVGAAVALHWEQIFKLIGR